ncbi:MAG: hypothetical protein ACM3Q2_11060 [Syntrophothermus sp.]
MSEKIKSYWERNWNWILQMIIFFFTAGIFYAKMTDGINARPDRTEINNMIDTKIEKHIQISKDEYIRIDQVPGLVEKLDNINAQLTDIKETNSMILQKVVIEKNRSKYANGNF